MHDASMPDDAVPLWRLYLLRAGYLVIAVGQGAHEWPRLLHPSPTWDLWQSVDICLLGALAAASLLGLRYPLKMLPLLFFELLWKIFWTLSVALPLWLGHELEGDLAANVAAIVPALVIVPLLIPWRYAWTHYVRAPGDRWK